MSFGIDIDLMPVCVAVYKKVNDDFIFVEFNKKAESIEGISKEDILGKSIVDEYPSVGRSGFLDILRKVEESGEPEILDVLFYRNDNIGGYRKNRIIKLPNGNIAVFFSDTNEKKKLDELMVEQKNMFQHVMYDSNDICIQGYNEDHEVVYWNNASEKLYGFSEKEAMGEKIEDLIIPEKMKERTVKAIDNFINNGVNIPSAEIILKDNMGKDVFVFSQYKLIQTAADKHELYCIDIDLSTTKLLQKEIIEQRDFLKTLFDVIPDLVWAKDLNGTYVACNSRVEKLFGKNKSEIIGRNDYDLIDKKQADFFRSNDDITIKKGSLSTNEAYLKFKNGDYEGYFETHKMPVKNSMGEITGVLGIARDVSIRKKYEKELLDFANTDVLTGLSNRAVFLDRLEQLSKSREEKERHGAVLFIDIDDFKDINDKEGHHVGDQVLVEIAQTLKETVRKGDTVARFGGDEFILILEQVKTNSDISSIVEKALMLLKKSLIMKEHELNVSVSIGISIFPTDSDKPKNLLRYADDAMYYAKKSGKDGYKFYGDIKESLY